MSKFEDTDTGAFDFDPPPAKLDIQRLMNSDKTEAQIKWAAMSTPDKEAAVSQFHINAGPEWYDYARDNDLNMSAYGLEATTDALLQAALVAVS